MVNILVVHGSYGNPQENWFPWLKSELKKSSCRVIIPKFPTPNNQSLKNWLTVSDKYLQHFNNQTIFVGHSVGVAFLLNILENLYKPIKAAFFVSGFIGTLNNPTFDKLNDSFANKEFDWNKIKNNCQKFFIFHSDNDPYVPLKKAEELAKNLGVQVIVVKNAGHFNEKAGYTKFDLLLEKIRGEI